ncbi:hypothetical protein SAMN02949497_4404 [Methylomagnum ishizawai]|uniref:Transcriptional regulator, AlpA family n=1 Tax=Methylomagnum ishizawai TaxID=1760988 RepID=A0A1Y6D221_9GAMM|nr:hypothetical protein [Methylomagnum ishizawai]SMF96989.1 hypothetical protein SAMN02949497_4404 [Methylomagnum ishizawai]
MPRYSATQSKPDKKGVPHTHNSPTSDRLKAKSEKAIPAALRDFDSLPNSANVRQPVVEALFGISATTVWRRSKNGLLPTPIRLGGTTVWNVGQLRSILGKGGE